MTSATDDVPTIEPSRSLRRFSPEVHALLKRVDVALALIDAADVWPAAAEALRFSAQVGTIHYSTLIEGNRLSVLEAERAARRELDAKTRAEVELVNYVDALALIDERLETDGLAFTEQLLKDVHKAATKGLGTDAGPFKPHHEGEWRDGEAGVHDPLTDRIVHWGHPQAEVRPRMLGLVAWIEEAERHPLEWPPAIIAGIVHWNVAEVHPFADGNGRAARLLASAMLTRHGMTPGRMFNFDAHYGTDKDAYLAALRSVRERTYNQETWIRYFLEGLASEYERVLGEIRRLLAIGRTGRGERVQLNARQERALTAFAIDGRRELTREDYERAAGVGRSQAAEDLRRLVEADVVVRVGSATAGRYRLRGGGGGRTTPARSGAPRSWTDERIEAELRALAGDDGRFPAIARFDAEGRRDLYQAIGRHGGSAAWAERLGLEPPRRGRAPRR